MPHSVRGVAAAAVGVLMFGTNYIPVRRYETYDGVFFQWMMGNGILGFGLLAHLAFGGGVIRHGLAGGALWALSNFLVLPVVKLLGLGVGFSLYHVVNLIVGYLVGRLGLLGAPVDHAALPALRDGSVGVLVLSFFFMVRVEPCMQPTQQQHTQRQHTRQQPQLEERAARPGDDDAEAGRAAAGAAPRPPPSASLVAALLDPPPTRAREVAGSSGSADYRAGYRSWRAGGARGARDAPVGVGPAPPDGLGGGAIRSSATMGALLRSVAEATAHAAEPEAGRRVLYFHGMHADTGADTGADSGAAQHWAGMPAALRDPLLAPAADAAAAAAGAPAAAAPRGGLGGRGVGVGLALLAGLTAGVNAVPYDVWNAHVRAPEQSPLTFVFSQCLGVYAASSALYLLWGLGQRLRGAGVAHSVVRPAYLSGVLWAIGLAGQMVAIEQLGMAEAYVVCAIGPVMVSALVSALAFGEIRGAENVRIFSAALALQAGGVLMLALGS